MNYEFLSINLASVTFKGLSSSPQRFFALAASLLISAGLTLGCYWICMELQRRGWGDVAGLLTVNVILVYYVLDG